MVGLIEADAVMQDKPQGRGYIRIQPNEGFPWPGISETEIAGHEFHYSRLEDFQRDYHYAYTVKRGVGLDGRHDGLIHKNMLACYAHLRDTEQFHWARHFIASVRAHKSAIKAHAATM